MLSNSLDNIVIIVHYYIIKILIQIKKIIYNKFATKSNSNRYKIWENIINKKIKEERKLSSKLNMINFKNTWIKFNNYLLNMHISQNNSGIYNVTHYMILSIIFIVSIQKIYIIQECHGKEEDLNQLFYLLHKNMLLL